MARWRAEALKRLPELRETINAADRIMMLWCELSGPFEDAYRVDPPNDSLIARIYSYADWCIKAPRVADAGHDPFTAVVVGFYEHIPTFKPARYDMPRWFSFADVINNRKTFAYLIGDEAFEELVAHMAKSRHLFLGRNPSAKLTKVLRPT